MFGLTADLQVQRLVVLADGVAGGAQVLAGVRELDIFQGERGHPRMAANHNIPVEALQQRQEGEGSKSEGSIRLRLRFIGLCFRLYVTTRRERRKNTGAGWRVSGDLQGLR